MTSERVRGYYESFDEWGRLDTAAGQAEFARMGRILDLGAGPGRYAIELPSAGSASRSSNRDLFSDVGVFELETVSIRGLAGERDGV